MCPTGPDPPIPSRIPPGARLTLRSSFPSCPQEEPFQPLVRAALRPARSSEQRIRRGLRASAQKMRLEGRYRVVSSHRSLGTCSARPEPPRDGRGEPQAAPEDPGFQLFDLVHVEGDAKETNVKEGDAEERDLAKEGDAQEADVKEGDLAEEGGAATAVPGRVSTLQTGLLFAEFGYIYDFSVWLSALNRGLAPGVLS